MIRSMPSSRARSRGGAAADAAVDRDDDARAGGVQAIDVGRLQAVAVAQPLRQEVRDVAAEELERPAQDHRRGDAVDVVVAVDGDALLAGDGRRAGAPPPARRSVSRNGSWRCSIDGARKRAAASGVSMPRWHSSRATTGGTSSVLASAATCASRSQALAADGPPARVAVSAQTTGSQRRCGPTSGRSALRPHGRRRRRAAPPYRRWRRRARRARRKRS